MKTTWGYLFVVTAGRGFPQNGMKWNSLCVQFAANQGNQKEQGKLILHGTIQWPNTWVARDLIWAWNCFLFRIWISG